MVELEESECLRVGHRERRHLTPDDRELPAGRRVHRERGIDRSGHRFFPLAVQRVDQSVFAGEVVIDGAGGDARPAGDQRHGCAVKSALDEQA